MFAPGDEVVCVRGDSGHVPGAGFVSLVEGKTYTIDAVWRAGEIGETGRTCAVDTVQLTELGHLQHENGVNCGFAADRFRKVQKRKDGLSIEAFLTIKPGQFEEPKRAPAKKRERV